MKIAVILAFMFQLDAGIAWFVLGLTPLLIGTSLGGPRWLVVRVLLDGLIMDFGHSFSRVWCLSLTRKVFLNKSNIAQNLTVSRVFYKNLL